jgi:hypothetical protein
MNKKILLVFCIMCAISLFSAKNSSAAIYQYMDKDGLVCFANDLQSIPEQYRPGAKIVSGEAVQGKEQATRNQQAGQQDASDKPVQTVSVEKSSALQAGSHREGKSVLLSAIIIVSAIFAMVILGVIDTDRKRAVTILRITILWGVTVYLVYAHAGDVVRLVRSANGKIEVVERESAEKGKKAGKAIKQLNALLSDSSQTSTNEPVEGER